MAENQTGNFMTALFDLSFHTFITPNIIRVLYLICLLFAALSAFVFLMAGFQTTYFSGPSATSIFLHVIGAPIIFVVEAIASRVALEFTIAVFRIAENTESLRTRP